MTPEQKLIQSVRRGIAPPPKISLSQWAEQNRMLSSESSSAPGAWHSYKFQEEILNSYTDPTVSELVCCSATQMIKTELILNIIAYTISVDPGPMMLVVPH